MTSRTPKLLDHLRQHIRLLGYSIRTEKGDYRIVPLFSHGSVIYLF